MTWETVEFRVDDSAYGSHAISLDLPPGWWTLPLAGTDTDAAIEAGAAAYAAEHTPPEVADAIAADLQHLAHAAAIAGAALIGIGVAVDDEQEDEPQLITATLLLVPMHAAPADDVDAANDRRVSIATAPSPIGDIETLRADYVVGDRWWLSMRTPALGHAPDMMTVFDAIADGVRIDSGSAVATAFGGEPTV